MQVSGRIVSLLQLANPLEIKREQLTLEGLVDVDVDVDAVASSMMLQLMLG
jgi:hypothetical protein